MATRLLKKQFLKDQARGNMGDGVTLALTAKLVARLSLSLMAWPEYFLDDEAALRHSLQTMLAPAIIKQRAKKPSLTALEKAPPPPAITR